MRSDQKEEEKKRDKSSIISTIKYDKIRKISRNLKAELFSIQLVIFPIIVRI